MRNSFALACGCMIGLASVGTTAHADIYQWEYINPADPGQGKRQSTTLAPDGADVDAVPGANLSSRDLTQAYLIGADLSGANFSFPPLCGIFGQCTAAGANLTDADVGQANLTNTNFRGATLTGVNFTGAEVREAQFARVLRPRQNIGSGISLPQLYSTASYREHDLRGINFDRNDLTGGNFAGQNLTNASFNSAPLIDASLTGALIKGANLGYTGVTLTQLYSTASYQAHDLSGIVLDYNNLAGGNFADQNLTNARFGEAMLSDADFSGAEVRGAIFYRDNISSGAGNGGISLTQLYSTGSYQAHDLTGIGLVGISLNGANFAAKNLTNARLNLAYLTGADFTDAEVRGASFARISFVGGGTGITLPQLYSTASYKAHDLSGIDLSENNLTGANFAGQNLANANISFALLTNADFTGADVRGGQGVPTAADVTTNMIRRNGHIIGLSLAAGVRLVVRDYDDCDNWWCSAPGPIPITVDQHLSMAPGGTLRMVFEADAWDSTISFAPGIPVMLGGTLDLTFADDVNLASQIGRTFDLFDWTGVHPIRKFDVVSPYRWDMSKLYLTGEVRLLSVPEPSYLLTIGVCLVAIVSTYRSRSSVTSRFVQVASRLEPLMAYAYASRPDIPIGQRIAIQEALRGQAEPLIVRYCE